MSPNAGTPLTDLRDVLEQKRATAGRVAKVAAAMLKLLDRVEKGESVTTDQVAELAALAQRAGDKPRYDTMCQQVARMVIETEGRHPLERLAKEIMEAER